MPEQGVMEEGEGSGAVAKEPLDPGRVGGAESAPGAAGEIELRRSDLVFGSEEPVNSSPLKWPRCFPMQIKKSFVFPSFCWENQSSR